MWSLFSQMHFLCLTSSRLFLFCVYHSCSDDRFQRCGLTCCFFAQIVRLLCATIGTHSGFDGFISLFVQENQTFHRSFSFNLGHFVDADKFKNNSNIQLRISLWAAEIYFSPNFLMTCFNLYVCIKLQACKSSIPYRSVFMCNMFIAMIYAESKLYYSIWSAFSYKCFHLCDGILTLSVKSLPWLFSSSPSLSSASSEISSFSSG